MDLILTPEIELVAGNEAATFPSFAMGIPLPCAAGPGDDDEDDEDPVTGGGGGGGGGNIDPDDDDGSDEEDEDDDEDPLWARPGFHRLTAFAASQHTVL